MTVLEKIKRCVSLVWDFQEFYGEEDIEDFCDKELSTYTQHNEIVEYFKHLAELEEENAELKKKLKTAYRKGMRHMAKALKDYDRTDGAWTDYFEHTVDKVLQREQLDFEEYGTLAEQLTKAKEIISEFVEWATWQGNSKCPSFKDIQDKAEAFLNSEV